MNLITLGVLASAIVSASTFFVGVNTLVAPITPVIHDELAIWLTKLHKGENCPPTGLIDSNGLRSSSIFCYQNSTFIGFVKLYNLLPGAEDKEILNFIGDSDFQWKLTRIVFEDNPKNWRHWECTVLGKKSEKCAKLGIKHDGIGLPPNL